ncbi:hypothetical protein GOODEAATRI_005430, partial [Goodea atripinnis]
PLPAEGAEWPIISSFKALVPYGEGVGQIEKSGGQRLNDQDCLQGYAFLWKPPCLHKEAQWDQPSRSGVRTLLVREPCDNSFPHLPVAIVRSKEPLLTFGPRR